MLPPHPDPHEDVVERVLLVDLLMVSNYPGFPN